MAFKDTKEMDYDYFNFYFYYDESSPSCIRWKISISDRMKKDDIAGTINSHGYWRVGLKSRNWAIHRIVYLLNHKNMPLEMTIDHLNGNRSDNNINNLTLKTLCNNNNNRNTKKFKENASGIHGVRINTNKQGRQYAFAIWRDENGKPREGKYYRIDKFPPGIALQLALEQRESEIKRLVSLGHVYTDRHGK